MSINPCLLFLSLALILGGPGRALGAGEGGGEPTVSNFEMTLIVSGKKVADTWINLSAGGTLIEIPASPVLQALAPMVDQETLRRLEGQLSSQGTFTNKVLSRFGISISINGPQRQVFLDLMKNQPKPKPVPAQAQIPVPPSEEVESIPGSMAKQDSGPWATPPVPALKGKSDPGVNAGQGKPQSGSQPPPKSDSTLLVDIGWEAGAAVDSVVSPAAPSKVQAPVKIAAPKIELQTIMLDRTRDELFEDVFKHKPLPLPPSIEVTLLVDGKSYGTLWINYSKEQKRYTFPADPVLNALQGLVKRELWEKLARRAQSQTRFTVEDLIECGFPTSLNTSVFELSTGVPAQLVGTKIHPMSGLPVDPYSVPVMEPSRLSAYLNTRVMERIPYYQYNGNRLDSLGSGRATTDALNKQPRQPVITNLDGAVNVFSWVLEGKGGIWEKSDLNGFEANRQDIRLVHDWPHKAIRLSVGDLSFPTSGFQSFLNMGGIGLSRDFSLQPHLVAYPVKDYEFFLINQSEVKVFINGMLRGTYQLEPGTHDLQGFPFTAGESEVEIQITDNSGQMQTINFNFIHEPSLLAAGRSAFSYNAGFPRRDVWKVRGLRPEPDGYKILNYEYDLGHPVLFLDFRRGFSDFLTMEAYSQALDTAGMVGFNALQAMKLGKIKADCAASFRIDSSLGWAANLEYTYIPKVSSNVSPKTWRLRMEYLSKAFFRPGQDPSYLGGLNMAGTLQSHSKFIDLNLTSGYTFRPDSFDFYNASLSLSRGWGKGWSTSFSLRNTLDRQEAVTTSVSATVSYYFNQGDHAFAASERVDNHVPDGTEKGTPPNWDYSTDMAWDYHGSSQFPYNPILKAGTTFGPSANEYTGTAGWRGNQGYAEVYGRRFEPKLSPVVTNYSDLTLQTALVYVDGNLAFSRPVTNSFVLVKGVSNEEACNILVNPNGDGYDAKSSNWRPGVVPTINPYYLKKFHLEVLDPPFGSSDERTDYTIYPGYKSGYAFYMGSSATIIALGTLLLAPGVPVVYQSFSATPLDVASQEPIVGFTNAAGKFQLTRLQPGSYRIEMDVEGKEYSLILKLPKKAVGITSVGSLILSPK
ncbi:MAG: hypothetical protein JWP91_4061 [Fibrobacteres bacterium]|nr:hypothetical protein [Fibrobacterota bacterium]